MSRSHHFTGLLAGTLAAIAVAFPAQAQDDAKAVFQARYGELRTAMEAHDADGVGKVMAPDYQATDLRGEVRTRADMMERMAKMAGRAPDPSRKAETTVISAVISGDTAKVEQQLSGGGKRTGDDGAEHTMEMVMKNTDDWAKRSGVWMLVKSVQTGITVKRDGEVFFQEGK